MKRIYTKTLKRVLLSTIIVLFSMVSFAATYYVSNTGNDSNSGLTTALPWQTLTKVNATTFKSGDQVLFQKGNTFYGSLTISSSGSAGSPIIFGAYGSGVNPIITGFTNVTSWTNLGNNIWESTSPVSTLSTCNMVVINGVNTAMGRFPNANATNSGYLIFQTHTGSTSITSSSLTGSPNWAGAELVMRENHYLMERFAIGSQSGGSLNFSPASVYAPTDGFGFFIQNDARTLDLQNEWYYNPSTKKIRIYSALQPIDVKVASATSLFTANGNYITASGVDFIGSNGDNIAGRGTNTTIQNCNVSFSGMNHISTSGAYYTAIDNTFKDTNNNGISVEGSYSVISRNTLTNSGVFQGMGRTAGLGINSALSVGGTGKTDYTIEGNTLINSGFNGIAFYANNVIVKNNFINTFCSVLDDGGGIYTYTGGRTRMIGTKIYGNIVINGIGDPNGISGSFPTIAAGIYCDNESANVEVYNNSVANCHEYGIFQNINHDNNIHNNTVYNTSNAQFRASWSTNITINNNIFVAKAATQNCIYISSGSDPAIPAWIIANNNYYARPIDDNKVVFVEQPGVGGAANFKTLAEWKTFSGQDAASLKSPQTITSVNDLQFEYNATLSTKTVTLSKPMIDVKGTKYATSVILQPYTSVVLMKDNTASTAVLPVLYNVTGGGSYTSGGSGVAIGLSGSQTGVNYQLKLAGVNNGSVMAGSGSALSFGNKTTAGVYTIAATIVSSGSTAMMTGSATVTVNATSTVVTGVSVSPTSASITTNSTQQLTAAVLPTNATNKTVIWSSSNTSVATVNSNGLVTGVTSGSATITATTQDGSKTATSAITVRNLVTGVSLSPTSASISVNATQQLTASVSPSNATNKTVSWSSSNTSVAIVNSNGLVTGIAAGTATITTTTQDGSKTAISAITVTNTSILVSGVSVSPTSASISVGSMQQLTTAILPTNATNKTVNWSSSNTSVATVNANGLVTGVAAGSATITVTTQDGGKTATSVIAVSSTNGATIGLNTIGSISESGINGYWIASSFTPVSNMTVNRLNLYVSNASGTARLGIYSSSSLEPGTLLAQSGDVSLVNGWNSGILGSSQNLVAGVTYWLAFEVNSSATALRYNTASGRSRYKSYTYGTLPTSPLKCSVGTGIYSIFADNNGLKNAFTNESALLPTDKEDLSGMVKIDVFPNPSKGNITVRFSELPIVGSRIDILDMSGRMVLSRIISETSEEINLEQQPNGIYLVKSIMGTSQRIHKLILNK